MPDCPNCGTWNPDDKEICWRCQTPMPKPQPEKRKRRIPTSTWMWVIAAVILLSWFIFQFVLFAGLR